MTPHIATIAKHNTSALKAFTASLYKARDSFQLVTDEDQKTFSSIIHHIFAAIAANTPFNLDVSKYWHGYSFSSYGGCTFRGRYDSAFDLIKLALSFGAEGLSLCKRVVIRLQPTSNASAVDWFKSWVEPFVQKIRPLLEKHDMNLTNDLFRAFIVTNMESFVKTLGKQPPETVAKGILGKFGCGCENCEKAKTFLLGSGAQDSVSAKGKDRQHIEKQLVQAGALTWGV